MSLFFTIWLHCSALLAHPMYVSMCNMDIDAPQGNITISIKIFTDDLETILHNKYNVDGWIGTPNEHRDGRRLLTEYVNERFSIAVNSSEKLRLVTDSMAIVDDAMWFYIRAAAAKAVHRVEVDNRLLTDFFERQTNLVIISDGRNEKGYKLDRKNHKIDVSLARF